MFSLISFTFSKFLKVAISYACLVTTALHINTLLINPFWCTLQSVLCSIAWLAHTYLCGFVWLIFLYFQDTVDRYEYIFKLTNAPKRSRYSFCGGVFGWHLNCHNVWFFSTWYCETLKLCSSGTKQVEYFEGNNILFSVLKDSWKLFSIEFAF